MQYLAYISFAFLAFQLCNALVNYLFCQKIHQTSLPGNEQISVLIPARNEEENIGALLNDIGKIKNPHLEILVFDDQSTDRTAQKVQACARANANIQLIQSKGLPSGWLGKNHACYQLARKAKGRYLLFIDADVRLQGNIVTDAINYLRQYHLGLLSIFPTQIQKTVGEKLTVPIMNYILLTLLPLICVRTSPFKSHAAANGQFMLFDADTYRKVQPHELFRHSPVEDLSISRHLKKQKIKTACLTGEKRVKCRMYKSYNQAFQGFSKNVLMFFGNKPLFAFLFWTFAAFGFLPVLLCQPQHLLLYMAGMLLVLSTYSITGKQNVLYNILFFPLHLVFLLNIIVKNMALNKQQQFTWKGRNIYSSY